MDCLQSSLEPLNPLLWDLVIGIYFGFGMYLDFGFVSCGSLFTGRKLLSGQYGQTLFVRG